MNTRLRFFIVIIASVVLGAAMVYVFGATPPPTATGDKIKVSEGGRPESANSASLGSGQNVRAGKDATVDGQQSTSLGAPLSRNVGDKKRPSIAEASISGKLVDTNGLALASISLRAEKVAEGNGYYQATTDDRGKFSVTELVAAAYRFTVEDTGDICTPVVKVDEGEHVTDIVLTANPRSNLTITGKVVDSRNQPIVQASVNAHSEFHNISSPSGENGEFVLHHVPDGMYTVSALAKGFLEQSIEGVSAAATDLKFQLESLSTVEGRVLDASNGELITEFDVLDVARALSSLDGLMWFDAKRTFNLDGKFEISDVRPGDLSLVIRARGYAPAIHAIRGIMSGQTISNVIVRLSSGGKIEGEVLDDSGHPVAETMIFFGPVPRHASKETEAVTLSQADGAFEIDSAPAETVTLSAWHPLFLPGSTEVAAGTTGVTRTTITLGRGGSVEGRVTMNSKPVPKAWVSISSVDTAQMSEALLGAQSSQTNADGEYRFDCVALGSSIVSMETPGQDSVMTREIVVEANQMLQVHFEIATDGCAVEGVVTLGDQAAEGTINAVLETIDGAQELQTQIGADGAYVFANLPLGRLLMSVVATNSRGSGRMKLDVALEAGKTVQRDIALNPGLAVYGHVQGGAGRTGGVIAFHGKIEPPQDASPSAVFMLQPNYASQVALMSNASYRVDGLEPGDYTIVAYVLSDAASPGEQAATYSFSYITLESSKDIEIDFDLSHDSLQLQSP